MNADQQGFDVRAAAGQHLARAVVEVEMQQLQDVFDFVAAYFTLLESIAGGDGSVTAALRRTPAHQSLRIEGASDAGVRRTREARGVQRYPQIVVVQLRGPARVMAVLRGQRRHRLDRQTGEPTDVAPHFITQRSHRVDGSFRGVQPALDSRDAEAHIEPGEAMSPRLGR